MVKRRAEAGLCLRCGKKPSQAGRLACEECRKRNSAAQSEKKKRQYRERCIAGLCPVCGKAPPDAGGMCSDCKKKVDARKERRKLKNAKEAA